MIKKLISVSFILIIGFMVACNDSTLDPGDNNTANPKYVVYTKTLNRNYFTYYWYSNFQIRRINLETLEDVLIRDTSMLVGISGDKVYYVINNQYSPKEVHLRRCDKNGENDELLSTWFTYQPRIFQLSPDGSKVLYFTRKSNWEIHCSNIDSTNDKLLYTLKEYKGENPLPYACFASDSKRIGILDQNSYPLAYLISCNYDGTKLKYEWAVSGFGKMLGGLSPNGMSFAYDSLNPGVGNIFDIAIIDFNNYKKKKITSDYGACHNIAWSPDGSMLAYYKDAGKLFIIDTSGANIRQITNISSNSGDLEGLYPVWSSDSKWLLFGNGTNPVGNKYNYGDLKLYNLKTKVLKTLVPEEKVYNAFFI